MSKLFVLFLVFFVSTFANSQPIELKMQKDGKYVPLKIKIYKGLKLTQNCFKSVAPSCDAFNATKKNIAISKSKIPLAGHFAARLCLDRDGLNRIATDKENKQYDYCLFKDGSMIDSWNLYYSSYPKKEIK